MNFDLSELNQRYLDLKNVLINIDSIYNCMFNFLYNPQSSYYKFMPVPVPKEMDNIYKILIANMILQMMKWFDIYLDKISVPKSLRMQYTGCGYIVHFSNSLIYTVAVLKRFELKLKPRSKEKAEYKYILEEILRRYVENQLIGTEWVQYAQMYIVNHKFHEPLSVLFSFLQEHTR